MYFYLNISPVSKDQKRRSKWSNGMLTLSNNLYPGDYRVYEALMSGGNLIMVEEETANCDDEGDYGGSYSCNGTSLCSKNEPGRK